MLIRNANCVRGCVNFTVKKPTLKYPSRIQINQRSFASSANKEDRDYEIDLISMKRTKRKRKEFIDPNSLRSTRSFAFTSSDSAIAITVSESGVNYAGSGTAYNGTVYTVPETANTSSLVETQRKHSGQRAGSPTPEPSPSLVDMDFEALDVFVSKYVWELIQLRSFITAVDTQNNTTRFYNKSKRRNVNKAIESFSEISTNELQLFLSLFESMIRDSPNFVHENVQNLQKMITNLRRIILTYKDVPENLNKSVLRWRLLSKYDILRFFSELKVLSQSINFNVATPKQVENLLEQELQGFQFLIKEASDFWRLDSENVTPQFINGSIQASRFLKIKDVFGEMAKENDILSCGWINEEIKDAKNPSSSKFSLDTTFLFPISKEASSDLGLVFQKHDTIEDLLYDLFKKNIPGFEQIFTLASNGYIDNSNFISIKGKLFNPENGEFIKPPTLALENAKIEESFKRFKNALSKELEHIPPIYIFAELSGDLRLLTKLRSELHKKFSESEQSEIFDTLKSLLQKLVKSNEVFAIEDLTWKLEQLFKFNAIYRSVLDSLIHGRYFKSQNIETSKSDSSLVAVPDAITYKQLPEGFNLDEFTNELVRLKKELGISKFEESTPELINSKLQEMCNDYHYPSDLKILFNKLYRNLVFLFKYNGNHTFVLDNVVQNHDVFAKFEATIHKKELSEVLDSLVANETKTLVKILQLNNWDNFSEEDFKRLSREQFTIGLSSVLKMKQTLEKAELTKYKHIITQLLELNQNVEDFPRLLFLSLNDKLTLLPKRDESEKYNVFNINEFKKEKRTKVTPPVENSQGTKYSNSEKVIASTSKNKQGADFKPTSVKHSGYDLNALQENIIKGKEPSLSDIETFLKDAQSKKNFRKESRFRENKAYEWSKSMYSSSRSLEAKNFFSPVSSFGGDTRRLKYDDEDIIKVYGSMRRGGSFSSEYLLITDTGDTIHSMKNPMGDNHIPEDIFMILNKYPKEDLHQLIKTVKKMQRKDWRLIGGGGKERMLVFTRESKSRRSTLFTRLKSVLATTGAVFISLVGFNYWMEAQEVDVKPPRTIESIPTPPLYISVSEPKNEGEADTNVAIINELADKTATAAATTWKSWFWSSK